MAVTRIKNNQITDSTIVANAKVQNYSVTSTLLANNLTYGSDLTITGNLTVNGQTTTIDTNVTTIEDPVIVLASNQTGTPTVDIGFIGERGTSDNIALVWDESADEFVTAFTSTTETNTTITISSYANFHTNDANIGGNLAVGGNIDITGNISSLNVTGNVTGGNLLTPGLISATGNLTGGNITTAGLVNATGNITGGNVTTAGITSTGSLTASTTINATGNITGGNVTTAGITSTGSLTASTTVSAAGNVTGGNLNTAGQVVATGNVTGGNLTTTGITSTDSLTASTTINATGNITGGNVTTAGQMVATANITGGNVLTAGQVSATGNVTGGNLVATTALVAPSLNVSGNITGGNLLTGGLISATGTITSTANVVGGNVTTAGQVVATGNVNGGNVVATANVIGGNLTTAGQVVATGNVTGGNVLTGGQVSATGNINGGNLNATTGVRATTGYFTGNVDVLGNLNATIGVVYANSGIFYGNAVTGNNAAFAGIPGFTPLGSNVVVQFAGNANSYSQLNFQNINNGTSASTDYIATADNGSDTTYYVDLGINSSTFNDPTNYPGFGPNDAYVHNHGGNLILNPETAGKAINFMVGGTANANVIGYVDASGLAVTGVVTATANITGGNLKTAGQVSATGNVTGGNVLTGGQVAATANITGGNILTAGQVSATGNVSGGNVNTNNLVGTAINVTGASVDFNLTGNVSLSSRYINDLADPVQNQDAATKAYVDSVAQGLDIKASCYLATAAALPAYTYNNGTSGVGATITLNATGNLTVDGTVVSANERILVKNETSSNAPYNGIYVVTTAGATGVAAVLTRATDFDSGSPSGEIPGAFTFIEHGSTQADTGWVCTTNSPVTVGTTNITFAQFSGAGSYTAGNALSLNGTQFNVNTDGNANPTIGVNGSNQLVIPAGAELNTPNIGTATGTSLTATANIAGGNLTTAGQVVATGNVNGGNVVATANVIGGNLTTAGQVVATGNITGGNVQGTLLTGTLTTAAQPNVTSVGTLSSLTVTANISGGNVLTNGLVSATGNVHGGNLHSAGLITATSTITSGANITGGNLLTGGLISATGTITSAANVIGGNVTTAGQVVATANITGGNILTGGLISSTGNITGGNLVTGGILAVTGNVNGSGATFTGNITAANFIGNIQGNIDAAGANTQVQFNDGDLLGASSAFTFNKDTNALAVTGNVTGGNLLTGGLASVTGNIIGGNVNTAGQVVATGNVNGGNVISSALVQGTTVSASGNVIGGNVTTTGQVVATANITGGNLLTGGLISATANITGGNVLTGGLISATGTITSTANVVGGNVTTAGQVVATANITGGNLLTGGLISATGNINGGNVIATSVKGGNIVISGDDITDTNGRVNFNTAGSDVDFAVNGDTVANVFYVDAGTGTASFGNATQTTNAIVAFNSTNSILAPVGTIGQRPAVGVTGMLRFNSTNNALEIYDNSQWTTVGVPSFTVIADNQFNGDGVTVDFTLSSDQTTNSCIVSINGVVQIPTVAYSVSGTTLTFTEAPQSGDVIDVRELTTTTTITSLSNTSGNAEVTLPDTANSVIITGELVPTGNVTQSLGSPSKYWKSLYVGGNTIYLGNLQLKAVDGTMAFYLSDGTTPAPIAASSVDTTQIASGTSSVAVIASGGNVRTNIAGSTVQTISSTGVEIVGNLSVTGNATLSGNILGDRVQNGTTSIDIQTVNGNANITVAGTSNVAVFASTGAYITGVVSASGNITGGNVLTGGIVSASGNITGGNILGGANVNATTHTGTTVSVTANITGGNVLTGGIVSASGNITGGNVSGTSIVGTLLTAAQTNITSVGTLSSLTVTANVAGGNLTTAGQVVATGNVSGANLVATTAVSTSSIIKTGSNAVGNIGSSTSYFNTVFAQATSALYADLAEKYVADAEYAPGTVVVFGGDKEVTVSSTDADRAVAGVVSTNPSYIMNAGLEAEYVATIALTGRVPCRVTGTVRKGDLMVSAGYGLARAEQDPRVGTVIGKALENYEGNEGVIEVVVGRF